MRACKFYSPGRSQVQTHEGLELSVEYGFDRAMQTPSCVQPEVRNGMPAVGCGFERDQAQCNFYTPEEPATLRKVSVEQGESEEVEVLELQTVRVKFGIREYYVVTTPPNHEPVQLHRVNSHEHGQDTKRMAEELFEYELQQRSEQGLVHELPTPLPEHNSYLNKVVNDEVRAAS